MIEQLGRCALVLSLLLPFAPRLATAADLPGGAFIVSPAKEELTLSPGETKTVNVTVSNGTAYPLTVTASYEDIVPKKQTTPTDDPIALVAAQGGADSLKDTLSFPTKSFDLLSNRKVEVPVTVRLPKGAEPGGRYGSVVWTFRIGAVAPTSQAENIAMQSRVATLFYVRSAGEAREDGALVGFSLFNGATRVPRPSTESPIRFALSYENKGDVHLNPYGRITVTGTFSGQRTLIVDPWVVLPGATRMREIDLFDPLSPGYYRAHLELNRGYKDVVDEADVAFWVMPSPLSFAFGLILFIVLILLIRRSLSLSRHFIS